MTLQISVGRRGSHVTENGGHHGSMENILSMMAEMEFKLGDKFSSYEQLSCAVKALEKAQGINFSVRDSRTIERAKGRVNFFIKPALQYYELKYVCMKGGRNHQSKSTGARPNQRFGLYIILYNAIFPQLYSTYKEGCEASFQVRASRDGQALVVTKLNFEHNHPINKV